jgi:hypothetical protein
MECLGQLPFPLAGCNPAPTCTCTLVRQQRKVTRESLPESPHLKLSTVSRITFYALELHQAASLVAVGRKQLESGQDAETLIRS